MTENLFKALVKAQGMIEVEGLEKVTRMEKYNHSCRAFSFSESKRNND